MVVVSMSSQIKAQSRIVDTTTVGNFFYSALVSYITGDTSYAAIIHCNSYANGFGNTPCTITIVQVKKDVTMFFSSGEMPEKYGSFYFDKDCGFWDETLKTCHYYLAYKFDGEKIRNVTPSYIKEDDYTCKTSSLMFNPTPFSSVPKMVKEILKHKNVIFYFNAKTEDDPVSKQRVYKFLLTDNKGQGLILPLKDAFKKK